LNGQPAQRADFWFGLFWTLLGFAILVESWRMERLEQQHINPYTIPGLVPGMLGVVLAIFGIVLAVRAWRGAAPTENPLEQELLGLDETPPEDDGQGRAEPWRVGLALVLCLTFAGGLVGSGLPFWLAAFVFLFTAILGFEWPDRRAAGTIPQGAIRAAIVAACASAAISFVFQEIFLVRLP
jgi:hypothetical protein